MSRAAYTQHDDQGARDRVIAALHVELEQAGVDPGALAAGVGFSPYKFRRRMSGETSFYVCEMAAICAYLNVPLGNVLGGVKTG